jgi:hypothetical protein
LENEKIRENTELSRKEKSATDFPVEVELLASENGLEKLV